jgi:hypothetical protein
MPVRTDRYVSSDTFRPMGGALVLWLRMRITTNDMTRVFCPSYQRELPSFAYEGAIFGRRFKREEGDVYASNLARRLLRLWRGLMPSTRRLSALACESWCDRPKRGGIGQMKRCLGFGPL